MQSKAEYLFISISPSRTDTRTHRHTHTHTGLSLSHTNTHTHTQVVDRVQDQMQSKAEYLGYGLCERTPEKIPEKWSITLFSEELVRGGGCSFVLSSFLVDCNTLQHTATHCNTLQHIATNCNTLLFSEEFWRVFSKGDRDACHTYECVMSH